MPLIRATCVLYWLSLTVLLLTPDPAGLLGLRWPSQAGPSRGLHFAFFAVLSGMVAASRWPLPRRVSAAILVAYAIASEALQWWVPNRRVEALDLAENLLGLLVGAAAWAALRNRFLGGRAGSEKRNISAK